MSPARKGDQRARMVQRIDGVVTAFRRDGTPVPYKKGASVAEDCEFLIGDTGIQATQESVTQEEFDGGRAVPKRMPPVPKPKAEPAPPPSVPLEDLIANAVATAVAQALAKRRPATRKPRRATKRS